VRPQQRGQQADGGGLAGAVRPQQAIHATAGDGEVDAVHRRGVAEGLAQAFRFDRGIHACSCTRGAAPQGFGGTSRWCSSGIIISAAVPYQGWYSATISPLMITGSESASALASSTLSTANTNSPRQPSSPLSKGPARASLPSFDSRSMLAKWPANIALRASGSSTRVGPVLRITST